MRRISCIIVWLFTCNAYADNEVIRIGFPNNPTYSEVLNGDCIGVFCDSAKEIFVKGLNLSIEVVIHPWPRIQREVENGDIDVMFAMPSSDRKIYGIASAKPVFATVLRVYTHAKHPRLNEIESIASIQDIEELGLVSVTNQGNGWHTSRVEPFGVKTIHVKDDAHILKMLLAKRGDIAIDATPSMRRIIQDAELQDTIVETNVILDTVLHHVIIGKKSKFKHLMPEVNRIIEASHPRF